MKILQRNNAILKIDMFNQRIIELYSLGVKNWTSFNMDASDMNDGNAGCYKRPFPPLKSWSFVIYALQT